ncbi:MAG: hypothetical protein QNK36_13050 [Colwellia sp.]|nr:hypothetical protein [Colwellia sp.]
MIKRLMTTYVPGMLTCEEVDSFLYDFYQGNLPFGQQLKFKMHIAMCSECKAYLDDYRNTIRLSKEAFVLNKSSVDDDMISPPIEKVPEDLMNAILSVRKSVPTDKENNEYKD